MSTNVQKSKSKSLKLKAVLSFKKWNLQKYSKRDPTSDFHNKTRLSIFSKVCYLIYIMEIACQFSRAKLLLKPAQ